MHGASEVHACPSWTKVDWVGWGVSEAVPLASKVASVGAVLVPAGGHVFVLGAWGREMVPASCSVPGGVPPVSPETSPSSPSGLPQAFSEALPLCCTSWVVCGAFSLRVGTPFPLALQAQSRAC